MWLLKAFAALGCTTAKRGLNHDMNLMVVSGFPVPKHPSEIMVFHTSTEVHWQSSYGREKKNLSSVISRAQNMILDAFQVYQ